MERIGVTAGKWLTKTWFYPKYVWAPIDFHSFMFKSYNNYGRSWNEVNILISTSPFEWLIYAYSVHGSVGLVSLCQSESQGILSADIHAGMAYLSTWPQIYLHQCLACLSYARIYIPGISGRNLFLPGRFFPRKFPGAEEIANPVLKGNKRPITLDFHLHNQFPNQDRWGYFWYFLGCGNLSLSVWTSCFWTATIVLDLLI